MIEINLLPTADKRKPRRSFGFKLPRPGRAPSLDRWTLAMAAAWLVGPAMLGWLYFGTGARQEELTGAIEAAQQDSARYARIIEAATGLKARRDTIAEKLQIIQQVDAGRYVWAHLMDEVSRALPEYTWLTELTQTAAGPQPAFQVQGRTGTTFALTRYLDALEASPFIKEVRLEGTRRIAVEEREIYEFTVRATYEEPPAQLVEMVPIFSPEDEPPMPVAERGEDGGRAADGGSTALGG